MYFVTFFLDFRENSHLNLSAWSNVSKFFRSVIYWFAWLFQGAHWRVLPKMGIGLCDMKPVFLPQIYLFLVRTLFQGLTGASPVKWKTHPCRPGWISHISVWHIKTGVHRSLLAGQLLLMQNFAAFPVPLPVSFFCVTKGTRANALSTMPKRESASQGWCRTTMFTRIIRMTNVNRLRCIIRWSHGALRPAPLAVLGCSLSCFGWTTVAKLIGLTCTSTFMVGVEKPTVPLWSMKVKVTYRQRHSTLFFFRVGINIKFAGEVKRNKIDVPALP